LFLAVVTSCTASTLNVTVEMREPFKGVIYTRGFPLECSSARHPGNAVESQQKKNLVKSTSSQDKGVLAPSNTASLSVPASECGVRMVPSKVGLSQKNKL